MAEVGYIRVSTVEQNTARQLEGVNLDKVFEDKCSGKDTDRPAYKLLMEYLREGDVLHVHAISRLARNVVDLLSIVEELNGRGVSIVFHRDNLTFTAGATNPRSEFMLTMLGAFAKLEREVILERQREGIAIAKAEGKYKGRQCRFTAEQIATMKARAEAGESKAVIAKDYGVTRQTIYSLIKDA